MTKFLFWNLNKREIPGFVGTLAREVGVDVLILAECVMRPERVLEQLNAETSDYQYAWGVSDHLIFFTRFDAHCLRPLHESLVPQVRPSVGLTWALRDLKPMPPRLASKRGREPGAPAFKPEQPRDRRSLRSASLRSG